MRVAELHLKNFGPFKDAKIPFLDGPEDRHHVAVLVGGNGSGKTLAAMALAETLVHPLFKDSITSSITSNRQNLINCRFVISNNKKEAEVLTRWEGYSSLSDSSITYFSDGHEHSEPVAPFHFDGPPLESYAPFPILAFYPVSRMVDRVHLEVDPKFHFDIILGYQNCLNGQANFHDFFQWYRHREDLENEKGPSTEVLEQLRSYSMNDEKALKTFEAFAAQTRDKQLETVRKAIYSFIPAFSKLRIVRQPEIDILVDKDKQPFSIKQLSHGERNQLALIGDIARRMAILNPGCENPLEGNGIVVIDEVDQHLHPSWQRQFIPNLQRTFPNVQFILTTHSPLVISEAPNTRVFHLANGEVTRLPSLYGQDANTVLLEAMETPARNMDVEIMINDCMAAIEAAQMDQARQLLEKLEYVLPDGHIDLMRLRLLLRKEELRHAQD